MVAGHSVWPPLATALDYTIKRTGIRGREVSVAILKPTVCEDGQMDLRRGPKATQDGDKASK